jgi:hypothetical protein
MVSGSSIVSERKVVVHAIELYVNVRLENCHQILAQPLDTARSIYESKPAPTPPLPSLGITGTNKSDGVLCLF